MEVIFQKMIIFNLGPRSRIQRRSKCQVILSHRIGIEPRLASSDPVFFGIRHVDQLGGNGVINLSPIVFLAIFWHHFPTFSHHLKGILKYHHHIEIFGHIFSHTDMISIYFAIYYHQIAIILPYYQVVIFCASHLIRLCGKENGNAVSETWTILGPATLYGSNVTTLNTNI